MLRTSHAAAGQAAGDIDPIVEAKRRMADSQLRAAGGREAREPDGALVGLTVAVGVFEIQNFRRAGDDQSAAPRHHAVGKGQARGELRSLIVATVAIGIGEPCDATQRRFARRPDRSDGATIFGHVEKPMLIERHRDRTIDQGFGRDKLYAHARPPGKRLARLLCCEWASNRQLSGASRTRIRRVTQGLREQTSNREADQRATRMAKRMAELANRGYKVQPGR